MVRRGAILHMKSHFALIGTDRPLVMFVSISYLFGPECIIKTYMEQINTSYLVKYMRPVLA